MKSEFTKNTGRKKVKSDFTGILLFILGVALIGISIFNLFEDPITNQYYKIKRNLSLPSFGNLISPVPTTDRNGLVDTVNPIQTRTSSPQTFESTIKIDAEIDIIEGFLPLNIEVSEITKPTPLETKEYDVVPIRLSIPIIDLNADIINATNKEIIQGEKTYIQWLAPDEYAIGWHFDTAFLGVSGNTVLNGHHNIFGKVFENLDKLVSGDEIFIYGNDLHVYQYLVTNTMILPERDVSIEERLENARWILPSDDERVTLITCWPYFSNTHRLIIVARPLSSKPVPITNERN
jgi:sortase A